MLEENQRLLDQLFNNVATSAAIGGMKRIIAERHHTSSDDDKCQTKPKQNIPNDILESIDRKAAAIVKIRQFKTQYHKGVIKYVLKNRYLGVGDEESYHRLMRLYHPDTTKRAEAPDVIWIINDLWKKDGRVFNF